MWGELLGYDPFLENVIPGIEEMAADLPCVHRWRLAEASGSHTVLAQCRWWKPVLPRFCEGPCAACAPALRQVAGHSRPFAPWEAPRP